MAYGQILRFDGGNISQYDAVRRELGGEGETAKPEGLLCHAAGPIDNGFVVMEWWDSEDSWNSFFQSRLRPAFEKVGGIPQPSVTSFDVHSSYPV